MRSVFLILLATLPQTVFGAPNPVRVMPTQDAIVVDRTFDPAEDISRSPASRSSTGIRACTYYSEDSRVVDVARLEMHSKNCDSDRSIENKLPDRPESDIYNVGEPFDVPKRN